MNSLEPGPDYPPEYDHAPPIPEEECERTLELGNAVAGAVWYVAHVLEQLLEELRGRGGDR